MHVTLSGNLITKMASAKHCPSQSTQKVWEHLSCCRAIGQLLCKMNMLVIINYSGTQKWGRFVMVKAGWWHCQCSLCILERPCSYHFSGSIACPWAMLDTCYWNIAHIIVVTRRSILQAFRLLRNMKKPTLKKAPTDLLCRLPNPFKWHSLFQTRSELSINIIYIFKLETPLVKWCYSFPYAQRVLNALWCGHDPRARDPCARPVKLEAVSSPLHCACKKIDNTLPASEQKMPSQGTGIFLLPNHSQVPTSSMIKKKKNQSSSLASK